MTDKPEGEKPLFTEVNFIADKIVKKDGTPVEEPPQDVLDAVNQRMTEIIVDYESDALRDTYMVPERDFHQAFARVLRGLRVDPNPTIFTVTGRSASRHQNPIYMYQRQFSKGYMSYLPSPLDDQFYGPWGRWRKHEAKAALRKAFANMTRLSTTKTCRKGKLVQKVRDWFAYNYALVDFVVVVGSVLFLSASAVMLNVPLLLLGFAFLALAICNPWLKDKW